MVSTNRHYVAQPQGTPLLDQALVATFKSILQDKGEDHFWPNLQLKTCNIKRLAANRWVSDLVIYHITELLNESHPDIFVFYYNFVSNIDNVAELIHNKLGDAKPKKK